MFSGFLLIIGGQTASHALSFVRNLILARVLTRADFGLAATFALAVTMLELTSRIALGRQVVQAKEGGSDHFLKTAHSFQFLVGTISAASLLLLCVPIAQLFNVPDKTWAFALLGLIPLGRGLWNLDLQRRQRSLEFLPTVWVELVPQVLITTLAWPLAVWIGDFKVVLILLLGKELLTTIMTHGLAVRPYRWGWDKLLWRGMWNFGWPLIINGLLLFGAQQGDQILVGGGYSLEMLALYSAAALLVAGPFLIVAHGASSIMLPILSRLQESPSLFNREYQTCVQLCALGAMLTMLPMVLAGEQILSFCYGPKYFGGGAILGWLAAGCAFRFLRIAPATAAMALADTQNQMLSNLLRTSSFALGAGALYLGLSVEYIAVCALIGELVALFDSTWRLKCRQGVPAADTTRSTLYLGACFASAGGVVSLGARQWSLPVALGLSCIFVLCGVIAAVKLFPEGVGRLHHRAVSVLCRQG